MSTTRIDIQNLKYSYDGKKVLDGINLQIESGEFVSIVGQSGCGKTTLLNCIAGFLNSEGKVGAVGRIGYVFQNHALYPFMTCGENIALGLGFLKATERQERVSEYLEIVGLPNYQERYPWQLSGGESQRIAIARAFAPKPCAVLLDEPLSALDIMRREAMMEWLIGLMEKYPTTVLMVTHWIDEAILASDRVVVLGNGVIKRDFPVSLPRPRSDLTKAGGDFARLRNEIRLSISNS